MISSVRRSAVRRGLLHADYVPTGIKKQGTNDLENATRRATSRPGKPVAQRGNIQYLIPQSIIKVHLISIGDTGQPA